MSKQKSDHLYNLIHSLSKGEKRFFKLYASRLSNSNDKKFIILFDAIEKQKTHNDDLILRKHKAFNPTQFSNLKAHLYLQILKSVKLCNASKQENLNITMLLDYARILYNKCLYKECVKMLDKAKVKAIENDCSVLLLEILDLEKMVIPKTLESGNEARVNLLIANSNHTTTSIKNSNVFSNLSLKMSSYYIQTGFSRTEKDLKNVIQFFKSSVPEYEESELSFQEKMYLYNSFIGYYFYTQNFVEGYKYATKLVSLFEKQPEMKRHKLEHYIKALNNLLVVQNKLYKYVEFVETLKLLVGLKRNKELILTENINLNLFKAIYIHEINRHFMLGEFTAGTRIVDALEHELNQFIRLLDKPSILLFYYKIACLFIGSSNFKIGVKWLNKIYNAKEIKLREDIHSFTRILLLVCHFEMNNELALETLLRSTYRYFLKKGMLSEYERNILNFIHSLFMDPREINIKVQFMNLKIKMLELENEPFEKRAFMYFDIISWLESKIDNESIEMVIKRKALLRIG